jgi:hypothetical protein
VSNSYLLYLNDFMWFRYLTWDFDWLGFRQDALVVSGNGTFNIFHAAVADFDGVTVKDLAKGVCFRKVLVKLS